jgi:hypothetical protein
MKHVKLFENFSSGKILLGLLSGYFPGIIDEEGLEKIQEAEKDEKRGWEVGWDTNEELNKLPEAILVMFDEYARYTLKPISKDLANQIYNVGGKDEYFNEEEGKNSQEEIEKVFFLATGESLPKPKPGYANEYISIYVTRLPIALNTIYWSENHITTPGGYFEEPYPITVDQAIAKIFDEDGDQYDI